MSLHPSFSQTLRRITESDGRFSFFTTTAVTVPMETSSNHSGATSLASNLMHCSASSFDRGFRSEFCKCCIKFGRGIDTLCALFAPVVPRA